MDSRGGQKPLSTQVITKPIDPSIVQNYGSIDSDYGNVQVLPRKANNNDGHPQRNDDSDDDDDDNTNDNAPYSVLQVRVVSSLIAILYSTCNASSSLISQYLLDRWISEDGHNRSTSTSVCGRNESDAKFKIEDDIQARVSITVMYYTYATCGPAILACVIFGALVDMLGRRCALISSLLGSTGKILVTLLIMRFDLNTNLFYLAFALDGIGGGFFVNLLALFSLTADVNHKKGDRILWISIVTCIGASTLALTNIGTGFLMEYISYFAASAAILVPLALSIICGVFFLPETLPVPMRQRSWKKFREYMPRMYYLYIHDGSKKERCALFLALMIFFTSVLNYINLATTDTLYLRHQPLCWDQTQIGFYSGFSTGGQFVLGVFYLKIQQVIGCARDEVMAMFGMLFMAAGYVLEAFVQKGWQMWFVPLISVPSTNIAPISRGVMSILAGPGKQGVLFSSIAVIEAICNMASATTYNKVYAATVDVMPGAVYLVMAGVSIITFLLFIPFFYCYDGPPQKSYETLVAADDDANDIPPPSQEQV